jgi:DNA-binding MarR family transcriptional regulator
MDFCLLPPALILDRITMAEDNQPDLQVEGWLNTLGIESLFQWDMLVFLYRHQSSLVSTGHIARLLGHATDQVSAALDSLKSSGLVECSRVSQGERLYQVTAPADPARRDALERLMTLADRHSVRLLLARRLRGSDRPDQNKNDLPLHGVKGSET